MIGCSLWSEVLLPQLPPTLPTEIKHSQLKTGNLRIGQRFFTQMELSKKNYVHLKDLEFHSEF